MRSLLLWGTGPSGAQIPGKARSEYGGLMKRSVVFVHGTGVREDGYNATLATVRAELHGLRPDWDVRAVCGARSTARSSSPATPRSRATPPPVAAYA
jgi:hypothetical protein